MRKPCRSNIRKKNTGKLNGLFTFVVGGAYSVDKNYRLLHGLAWWPDEQPSDEIKRQVEEKLEGDGLGS